jgi:hypothetical protein
LFIGSFEDKEIQRNKGSVFERRFTEVEKEERRGKGVYIDYFKTPNKLNFFKSPCSASVVCSASSTGKRLYMDKQVSETTCSFYRHPPGEAS